jgi:hypothetical protein
MKRAHHLAVLLAAALPACGSDPAPDSLPGSAQAPSPLDTAAVIRSSVDEQTIVQDMLVQVKLATNAFVADGATLDPLQSAADNADRIAQRLATQVKACGQIVHAPGSNVVAADLSMGCVITDTDRALLGQISATVSTSGGRVSVAFALTKLVTGNQEFSGIVVVGVGGGAVPSLDVNVNVDALGNGHLLFTGTASAQMDGDVPGVTLNGTGTFDGPEKTPSAPFFSDWLCTVMESSFESVDLHQISGACYARSGSVIVKRAYDCRSLQPSGEELAQEVKVKTTIQWSPGTEATRSVDVTLELSGQDGDAGKPQSSPIAQAPSCVVTSDVLKP